MKYFTFLLTLAFFATSCTDKRESMISEKLKSEAESGIAKSLGKSEFTPGYVSYFVKNMQIKLQSYDESTRIATVEIQSLNKTAQDGLVMTAMLTSGKLAFDEVVKLYEKEAKRSIASLDPQISQVKCEFEEKEGKEVIKNCK